MFNFLKKLFCCYSSEDLYNPVSKKRYKKGSILPIDRSDKCNKRRKQNRMKYYI